MARGDRRPRPREPRRAVRRDAGAASPRRPLHHGRRARDGQPGAAPRDRRSGACLDRCPRPSDLRPSPAGEMDPGASCRAAREGLSRGLPRSHARPAGFTGRGGRRARRRDPGPDRRRRMVDRAPRAPWPRGRRSRPRRLGNPPHHAPHLDHRPDHDREMVLDGEPLPAGAVVLVSPLLLGRLPNLVPGDPAGVSKIRPRPLERRPTAPRRLAAVRRRAARLPGAFAGHGGPHAPCRVVDPEGYLTGG